MRVIESFVGFDDLLLERAFSPIAEWTYSRFGISNFRLASYLCVVTIGFDFYDIHCQLMAGKYSTALLDLVLLGIFSLILRQTIRDEARTPAGTMSPFRYNYYGRFGALVFNIIAMGFMHPIFSTLMMSNLLVLIYYFLGCDKPKGDRLAAFQTHT